MKSSDFFTSLFCLRAVIWSKNQRRLRFKTMSLVPCRIASLDEGTLTQSAPLLAKSLNPSATP
jgi:hypothetical protein